MSAVTFDERGLGTPGRLVPWSDLESVAIRTTDAGPWEEDVFWLFRLHDGGLLELPGALLTGRYLEVLQAQLDALDNEKVIRAMGSTEPRLFRIWHREAARYGWNEARGRARFRKRVQRSGGVPERADDTFDRLVAAWNEAPRRFHTPEHLGECLHQLDLALRALGDEASCSEATGDAAELALWFHDAVYVPGARDNEARSAEWLLDEGRSLGIESAVAAAAAEAVRLSSHRALSSTPAPTAALVLDVDLSILGAEPLRFLEYEHSIAEEYGQRSALAFRIGRGRFLSSLLARPFLFHTPYFRERYEATARAQVEALLKSPAYRAHRLTAWIGNWGTPVTSPRPQSPESSGR